MTIPTPLDHIDELHEEMMQLKDISNLIRAAFSNNDYTPNDDDMAGVTYAIDGIAKRANIHADAIFDAWRETQNFSKLKEVM